MNSLRQRQIDEVLQYDKVINSRVFGREVDQVSQFNDPKSRPNKDDITFQAEVEKRVEDLMNTVQRMNNNISDVETPSSGELNLGVDEGTGDAPVLGEADFKGLKSLADSKSLKDKINTSDNLTADILSKYNSLVDYILQYKRYTIYGNQSVQDAQFSVDKIKTLLQPLKSLLMRIQSSGNDELFSKSYNVLNKIIESIESAPPFIKIDNKELSKEVPPTDVSKLEKYYTGLDKKLIAVDKKIEKAKSAIVYTEREADGKNELIRQLEQQKREIQLERAKGDEPEVKYAIEQYKEIEDESLTPDERRELLERFNRHISALEKKELLSQDEVDELEDIIGELVSNGTLTDSQGDKLFERIVKASPTGLQQEGYKLLSSAVNEYQNKKTKESLGKESEYSAEAERVNQRLVAVEQAIEKDNSIKEQIKKLQDEITALTATIKPTTARSRRTQIANINRAKQAQIATLQADPDLKTPAQLRALKALKTRLSNDLQAERKRILGNGKVAGRKFQGQYAPRVDDYDENEMGDTNQNDNLEDIEEDYIVDEDDMVVGRGKKVCMPKNDYMKEHHHLINLLNSASGNLKKEAKKQKKEIEGSGLASDLLKMVSKVKTKLKDDKEKGVGAFDQEFKENYKKNPTSLTDALANAMTGKKGGASSNIQKGMYPRGKPGPSTEDCDKAYNMAMAIDKASRKKIQMGKEEVKALKPVLPLGGIPEFSASGAGRVTKGEDFGMLLAKLKDGKKSRELKKAKKSSKYTGGALSFNDDNNEMFY